MSYYIEPLRDGEWDFRVKKENLQKIIDKFHARDLEMMNMNTSLRIARHATNECHPYPNIESLFEDMGYAIEFDNEGNIDGIIHDKEKLWNDYTDFRLMAEYVEKGSCLDFIGENGNIWRWYFDGETVEEYYGVVTFPEAPNNH